MINFLGATAVPMPLVESRGFSFDLDTFRQKLSPRTKMVVLNSPANPTGGMIPREDLAKIADMLRERDVLILSDEIYSRICYGVEPASITQFPGMLEKTDHPRRLLEDLLDDRMAAGIRRDAGVAGGCGRQADGELELVYRELHAAGGLAALQGPQDAVDAMVAEFRRRRDVIVEGLNEIPGFRCVVPDGAFYAFPNVSGTGVSSQELADLLLNEAGVACLSGTAFGSYGDGYLRFSYAASLENIQEALGRIRKVSERWAAKLVHSATNI